MAYWSAACTLLPVGLSAAVQAAQPCRPATRTTVTPEKPFRCDLALTAGQPVLIRVDQAQVDVTVELFDSSQRSLVKVDSPTRRGGPELLLASTPASGTRALVVASSGKGTAPISVTEPSAAEARGLALLTSSAAAAAAETKQREADLRGALTEFRKVRATRHEAEALSRIAATDYWVKGDWIAAASSAQEAMRAWEKLGDDVMWSHSAVVRAASLIETAQETQRARGRSPQLSASQFDEAERLLSRAASSFRAAGLKYDEAHALNNSGLTNFYRGRHDAARSLYTRAASMFRTLGDDASEMLPLQNITVLDFDRGDYAHAVDSYRRLLAKIPANHDPLDRITLLNNLALAHDVLGNAGEALRTYMAALEIAQPARFAQHRARTLHGLGNLYLRLGDSGRGGDFLEQALAIRRAAQPVERRSLYASLIAVGEWHRERGDPSSALKLHLEAYEHALSPAQKARTHLAIGRDQMDNGSMEQALASFERGLSLDLPDEWPVRVSLRSAYGDAKLRTGDPIGYSLVASAAATHRQHGNDELAAQDYLRLAMADREADRLEEALRNAGTALSLFERQRASAMNPDLRATYAASHAVAYELQAEIYMLRAERAKSVAEKQRLQLLALATVASRRARTLQEFRQLAQPDALAVDRDLRARHHRLAALLEQQEPQLDKIQALRKEVGLLNTRLDLLHAQRPAAAQEQAAIPSVSSVEAFRRSMPADTLALVYLLGDVRSWLWAITRDGIRAYQLSGRADMERAARDLQELWSRPLALLADGELEEAASRTLLGAAAPLLREPRKLEIVADGELRRVPFGALRIPRDGGSAAVRLVQLHTISLLPSLDFFSRQPAGAKSRRMLLVGDPLVARRDPQSIGLEVTAFRALPGARQEIVLIKGVAENWQADALTGARATKATLLGSPLASYDVLHFATHARADVTSPQLSTISLSPSSDENASDAALSLREIVGLNLKADMVVLSACEGALGKQYRGQLSFGLSEAFLLGGSRSVVGSLWRVSDAATQRYMALFYDQYITRGASPAAAAQRAARVMMSDPKYAHPFFWAAFVVLTSRTLTRGGDV